MGSIKKQPGSVNFQNSLTIKDLRLDVSCYFWLLWRSKYSFQINKLSSVHKYSEINFHLILFPVPDKTKIVNWFISQAKNLKNDADE